MSHRIELIGGPHDGEAIEVQMPPIQGKAYPVEGGRYVVLGGRDLTIVDTGITPTHIMHAFFEPERAPTPSRRPNTELLEHMGLGVIVGIMWAGVGLSMAFMFWLGGWVVSYIAEHVPTHILTLTLLAAGGLAGAGWAAVDYLHEDQ